MVSSMRLKDELRRRVQGKKVLVLGVGNRIRGDDALGSILAGRLNSRIAVPVIDASDVPENYLGPLEASGAELVLIVDAVDFHASPGDVALFEIGQLVEMRLATHAADLSLLFKTIHAVKPPEAILIGVQPVSTELLSGLSRAVSRSLDELEEIFVGIFSTIGNTSDRSVSSLQVAA